MVGLVGIIQVDLLLEQCQGVSDEEVSHVLCQEVIDACKDSTHGPLRGSPRHLPSPAEARERRNLGRSAWLAQDFILRTLGKSESHSPLTQCLRGTGLDLDTELQSKFLLLKVKKISQVFELEL